MSKEIWKDIPNWKGFYQASNLGRIRSLDRVDCVKRQRRGRVLSPAITSIGYLTVQLHKNGKGKMFLVHRLVVFAFLGKSKSEVNHKDADKENNKIENLEYLSRRENINHRHSGKLLKGVRKTHSKKFPYAAVIKTKGIEEVLGLFSSQKRANEYYKLEAEKLGEGKYI